MPCLILGEILLELCPDGGVSGIVGDIETAHVEEGRREVDVRDPDRGDSDI